MYFNFFGIKIDKKTDILALAAFLISIAAVISNIYYFMQGADIELVDPKQIVIKRYENNEQFFTNFFISMTYYNDGHPGYSDVIKKESAIVIFNNVSYEFIGQYSALTDRDKNSLNEKNKGPNVPLIVKAREAVTHETHFEPIYSKDQNIKYKNFIYWDLFLKDINEKKIAEITFKFEYETFSGSKGSKECKVKIDDDIIYWLNEKQWTSTTCK